MPKTEMTHTERAAGFRAIADILDTLPPDLEPPSHYAVSDYAGPMIEWLLFSSTDDQRARAAAVVRAIGGKWDKSGLGDLFNFTTVRDGVTLEVTVQREQVCRRVVTGTREVTKEIPDPDAPKIAVTETVEDVEWECEPLLAGVAQ